MEFNMEYANMYETMTTDSEFDKNYTTTMTMGDNVYGQIQGLDPSDPIAEILKYVDVNQLDLDGYQQQHQLQLLENNNNDVHSVPQIPVPSVASPTGCHSSVSSLADLSGPFEVKTEPEAEEDDNVFQWPFSVSSVNDDQMSDYDSYQSVPKTPTTPVPTTVTEASSSTRGRGGAKGKKVQIEKGSEDYKERRRRNNVAVRKSRDKAKHRQIETERKLKLLLEENEKLRKKCDVQGKELVVLRGLFTNLGASLPDEVAKFL